MPVAETPPSTGIWNRTGDAHRSLSRIAARLLFAKDKEELGLEEIDRIAVAIERAVRRRFLIAATLFLLCILLSLFVIAAWAAAALDGQDSGQALVIAASLLLMMAACIAVGWRHFQYGLGIAERKRTPVYGNSRRSTVETLEKLFDYLGRRTGPSTYYYDRKGNRRPVHRRHFYGRLRGLLLSEIASDRAIVLPPHGFWFTAQIYIDAEPEDIIRALKVRPSSGGRPKEFDYEAMLLALIEHPALRTIDPDEYGAETEVMNLIRNRCEPSDDHDNDIPVPESTRLRAFAKEIAASIKINRGAR
ncbi:Putative membrane protein [Sphingopyxis fribergensis]|uniref:Putative membrane protein n=1 Tax=Sphingopyxis fribergensis TaxID=1515612 RepID=A0A0A7PGD0_9SPHN|nr:Putative membrane protein [Sphingopyxis fribergensis]